MIFWLVYVLFRNKAMLKDPTNSAQPRLNGPFLSSIFKYFGCIHLSFALFINIIGVTVFNTSFESIKELALDYESEQKQVSFHSLSL